MNKRPISVTMIAWLYMAVGAAGFVYHLGEFKAGEVPRYDVLGIELVSLAAAVCGAFMLRGKNWARWIALAWMGFHVIVSVFHSLPQFAIHCLFFALIAWVLFRPDAARYFSAVKIEEQKHGDPAGR